MYGKDPSIVIVAGEIETLVDIWERSVVPMFVMLRGIVSVWPGVKDWVVVVTDSLG